MDIVGGGNLKAARAEVHLHVVVLNHRDFPVDKGDEDLLAPQPVMAFVARIDADGGIGHDGLRAGCGYYKELVRGVAVAVRDEIPQMIEMALGILVDDFVVTYCGKGLGVPVDHAHALVNPAFLVEIHEGVDYGVAEGGLHGEAGAVPVAGASKLAELLQDNASVLLFPFPGVPQELLTADILLLYALGLELCHHL